MGTSVLHIKTEVECKVFLFDEEKGIAYPDKYFNLEVRKGEQDLLFVSTSNEDLQCSMLFQVEDTDCDYRIMLAQAQFATNKTILSDTLLKHVQAQVTKDEIAQGIEDDFGVVYSQDGTQLLKSKDCYITSYQVKEGCKIIRSNAFLYHRDLLNVALPDSLLYIGNCAFSGCSILSSITLPSHLTYIGDAAFFGCSKLDKITLPISLTHIGYSAFESTQIKVVISKSPNFTFTNDCLVNLKTKSVIAFLSDKENVVVPEGIKYIGDKVFEDCKNLLSVTLPEQLTHIGDYAFCCCVNLASIILPSKLTHIGNYAFGSCRNLSNIILPNNLTYIGDGTFSDCKKYTNIVLPASLTHVGKCPFDNTQLKNIVSHSPIFKFENGFLIDVKSKKLISCHSNSNWIETPEGLTEIEAQAFVNLENLSTVVLNDGITRIGESAFVNCSNLTNVHLPNSLTHIEQSAFLGCEGIKKINLPNGLSYIGKKAFSGCYFLSEVNLPNSLNTIDEDAFSLCKCLSSITLPNKLTHISKGVFVGCENLSSISLPNSLTHIEDGAFYGCRGLESIRLPNGLTHIGEKAFSDCTRLNRVSLPDSITYIGKSAFANCKKLSAINIPIYTREHFKKLFPQELHGVLQEVFECYLVEEMEDVKPYYLFFDTETTGIPRDYNAPASNTSNWPRLVQLGWILTDESGNEISSGNEIVKPVGFSIPSDASRVHGITTEVALRNGKPLKQVIESFLKDTKGVGCFVGHNVSFDQKVVGAELHRLGIADTISTARSMDTMIAATDFCKIPGTYGYKWPKLIELHRKLFGCDFEDAHDAMADITATKKCFFEMRRRNLI